MTHASPSHRTVYALIGASFARELYEPLYQRSVFERAQRHARSRGLRRSDGRRWHSATGEAVIPPARLRG